MPPDLNVESFPTTPRGKTLLAQVKEVFNDAGRGNDFFCVFEYGHGLYGHLYQISGAGEDRHGANDRILGTVERMKIHMANAIIEARGEE